MTAKNVPVEQASHLAPGTSGGGVSPAVLSPVEAPPSASPISDQIDKTTGWVIDRWQINHPDVAPHPDYLADLVVEAVTDRNLISFAVETIRRRVAEQLEQGTT